MVKALQLGIIGCGGIARNVAFLARLNLRIRLIACCDKSLDLAEPFAKKYHIPKVYDDYRRMLNGEKLDAVYLATPHHLHFEMIQAAIQRGLNILTEKPITRTLEEGKEVVRLAKEAGVKLGVDYQYRYDAGCYPLAMAARQGALGKLYYGRANIPWCRQKDYFEKGQWHINLATAGGGTLLTQASHILDILLWSFNSPPRAALGWTARQKFPQVEVEDLAMGTVELENGAGIQICSSMVSTPEQAVSIEVYGEHGTAIYSNLPMPRVHFRGVRVKKASPPARGLHALQRSLNGFTAWVLDDRPFLIPGEEALPVLATIDAIYRSAQTGNKETINN